MGGRGAGLVVKGSPSGGGGGGNGGSDEYAVVAKINRMYGGNKQNIGHMMDVFRNEYVNDTKEHLITVDEQGFAHVLINGKSGSVSFGYNDVKGKLVIHNHPWTERREGGVFSKKDLDNLAGTGETGIIASERKGDWIVTKNKNFNASGFSKGLDKSGISNYIRTKGNETPNEALTRQGKEAAAWLTANQKKYGYTFRFRTDSRNGSGAKSRETVIAEKKAATSRIRKARKANA